MRISPLKSRLAAAGASFAGRCGVEICAKCAEIETEYRFVRDAAAVTDFSFMQTYRIPEAAAIDFLDTLLAGNVAKVRFGRMLHTFLADSNGFLVADCYVANNDDEFLLVCESLADDASMNEILQRHGAKDAGIEDLSQSHAVIGIDGYKAWAVVKELFGADVLGLPYLSIEKYPFESGTVRLVRAGKTSEFGYLLIVPNELAVPLYEKAAALAAAQGGGRIGVEVHNTLRLEGRFFNIFAEGAAVKDPLVLGLQWMIDFDKEAFDGRDAILDRRAKGVAEKIIGVRAGGGAEDFAPGAVLYDGAAQVGRIVASCYSHVLGARLGLALFPRDIAYAGLSFHLGKSDGAVVQTISMPPIMPKSLTVKLDEI